MSTAGGAAFIKETVFCELGKNSFDYDRKRAISVSEKMTELAALLVKHLERQDVHYFDFIPVDSEKEEEDMVRRA